VTQQPIIVTRASAPASTYLGGGVYASYNGSAFALQIGPPGNAIGQMIWVGPEELGNLFTYASHCLEAIQEANDK